MKFERLTLFYNKLFKSYKIPSLKFYQSYARIYLDEYKDQKELRKEYFLIKQNLLNTAIRKIS